jgi:hypothetical protein
MSYYGSWGMFNQVPFSGGKWMVDNLKKYVERGKRFGSMHDLGVTEWAYSREFMLIRQMPEWYRSAHGYMSPNWRAGGTDSHLWNTINSRMCHIQDDNFDRWMENVYEVYPGLSSWVLNCYAVPKTEVIHLDDAAIWLTAEFGFKPIGPNNTHKDPDVVISDKIRAMCKTMEDPMWWMLTRSEVTGEH